MPHHHADIIAITVTFSSEDRILPLIESLSAAGIAAPDITVIENASPGAEETTRRARAAGARVLSLPRNLGYGGALNRGVAESSSRARYLVLTNPDIAIAPEAITTLAQWLDTHPTATLVGPQIQDEDGSVYPSARALPTLGTGIGHAVLARFWPRNPWTRGYHATVHGSTKQPRTADWLSGAFLMIRRADFDALGGFDERYFMYFEDVDLGRRITQAGGQCVYVPAAVVVHTGGASTRTTSVAMLRAHHQSAYRFLCSVYQGRRWAPLRGLLRYALAWRFRLESRTLR